MPTHADRFTRRHPCPVCGGYQEDERGRGTRCAGYIDETGLYARCSREEYAGGLEQNSDSTYSHRLEGSCLCGTEHGTAPFRPSSNGNGREPHIYEDLADVVRMFQSVGGCGRWVATYEYRDEQRELLFVVLRFDPKTFRQARPMPGGWIASLGDVRRLLYRTPEIGGNRWVIVVEGEKDADRLADTFASTTSPGGAEKWRQEYSHQLQGRKVCFIADADEAGAKHVQQAAAMTYPLADEVKVLTLEEKDVSDWLDAGHDVEELKQWILDAPDWTPAPAGAAETAQEATEAPEWIPVAQPAPAALPQPPDAIFHGLPGRLSRLIVDYVESDQASILVQLLTAFGVAVGVRPVFMVGATRHSPAVYTGLIGRTSRARKGTGGDAVESLMGRADIRFADRIMSGLGSGENLIHLVRDPDDQNPNGADRRLLLREPELARLLVIVNREGSTLSHYLREAFDGKPLRNAVKRDGATASEHRIGMIGHCTPDEIRGSLNVRQVRNGLANRIGWFLAKRERTLPRPPVFDGPDVTDAGHELRDALHVAKEIHCVDRDKAAWLLWDDWYNALPDEDTGGMVAAITDRAEALVTRWSLIYALMDRSPTIESSHLEAAFSLYDYERACVEYIWGRTTGDPMADRVLADLAYGPMLQSEVRNEIFGGHASGRELERLAYDLESTGLIRRVPVRPAKGSSGGRPALRWERI